MDLTAEEEARIKAILNGEEDEDEEDYEDDFGTPFSADKTLEAMERLKENLKEERERYPDMPYSYKDTATYPSEISIDDPPRSFFFQKEYSETLPDEVKSYCLTNPREEVRRPTGGFSASHRALLPHGWRERH